MKQTLTLLALGLSLTHCAPATRGPDKQFAGSLEGAAVGAGTGAVTGFQVGAGTGPGALVGAGFGAVAGGVNGFLKDQAEEDMLRLAAETRGERKRAIVHEVLSDHYKRRLELHPSRDIYPADLFFFGDEATLKPGADALVKEIARLNKQRLPWSRLVVVSYAKSVEPNTAFAKHVTERRAKEVADFLVRGGLEPRRVESRGVLVPAPVLIDPNDNPGRYNQAIEIIPLDR